MLGDDLAHRLTLVPDEAADETRGSGKVEPDGKRAELGRKPRL